jgi:cyclopropane-fatty-acyl-phospholipid synthase
MWTGTLDSMLGRLVVRGRLTLEGPGRRGARSFGPGEGAPHVTVRLADEATARRLVLNPELAVGEAYMDGTLTIEGDDLRGFMELLTRNRQAGGSHWVVSAHQTVQMALRRIAQHNPMHRARRNVAHHYDLSGELYDLFLDEDRQYSCGYFARPDMTLEEAQAAKKHHIAGKLLLEPGMRVLDIGCGWGGMALTLARDYGARVLGVTLSREQHAVATERAEAAGLSDRVEFRLQDYRKVRERFDRIVSVGMFEHVGVPHYGEYFETVDGLLEPGGVALIHTIGRSEPPGTTSPWIAKYIFPGGYIPALSEVMAPVERSGLWPCDVEVWRLHYAYTLKHWYDRFMANIDRARTLYDERFCRMWRYYLVASEMSFRHHMHCVFQLQLATERDAVPLTRDYLHAAPGRARLAAE